EPVVPDRSIQGDGGVDGVQCLVDVIELVAGVLGELLESRLASELELESGARPPQLLLTLLHVRRDADGVRLVGDRPLAGLADPPGGVRRDIAALAPADRLGRAVEADRPLLDEVAEGNTVTAIALRVRHHEPEVAG